ncbi:zinc finger protein 521-like [Diabrotica virgifera virgifera]|uniref:Zinc finger protein 521-like n=1 Tax=Diabrotica virgifera virgifera TaxID=50390 RepID=A0A6P7EY17_DIAVI|nr:zinc finger protein 521-like [Diabrotica virgifera virgifera]
MTMYTLPNFCRVCLKYDKNLIDLQHIENEPGEALMTKLQHCVAEVEWTIFKPLLCHPCVKRLNVAYSFKKQCTHSAGVLKNYIELVKESQKKNESQNAVKSEATISPAAGTFMLLPNQKYVKILVGGQNQGANTFQNVFLNLIPANALNPGVNSQSETNGIKTTDTNQNVFLNLNSTFQKFIPLQAPELHIIKKPPEAPQKPSVNVNQILTETKTEELSVEIDPTIFGLEDDEDSDKEEANDYDEVISQAKIHLTDLKENGEKVQNGKDESKYYVPILPKSQEDFFSSSGQHFLFGPSSNQGGFSCEACQKSFASKKLLKTHIKQFHLGKLPFKCEYCYGEFTTRTEYEMCVKSHKNEGEAHGALTLQDFKSSGPLGDIQLADLAGNIEPTENGDYVCDVCHRPFNSATGVLRHKVRKHNQKNKKKYFIKGMKNARCDICNREFSTQSYMQLHKKLHLRDDVGCKFKVFGKSKYGDMDKSLVTHEQTSFDDSKIENLDVTPDIFTGDDSNEESKYDPSTSTDNRSVDETTEKMEVDEDDNLSENDNETDEDDEEEEEGKQDSNPDETNVIVEKEDENLSD